MKKAKLRNPAIWSQIFRRSVKVFLCRYSNYRNLAQLYFLSLSRFTIHKSNHVYQYPLSSPTFPRRIDVFSALCINVEITLIQRWKWQKIRRRIFNVAQRLYNVSTRRWNNVETTLHNVHTTLYQRCFNVAWTLVKAILNPVGLLMIMNL